jgi:hypothetical protein
MKDKKMMKVIAAAFAALACVTAKADNALASAKWAFKNYESRLSFETNSTVGCSDYFVVEGASNQCDTAWSMVSSRVAVPQDAREFLFSVDVKSHWLILDQGKCGEGWNNAITWFGANGKKISAQPIPRFVVTGDGEFHTVREWGRIPAGAASCTVRLGFDEPNVGPGEEVCFRGLSLELLAASQSRRSEFEKMQKDQTWLVDSLYPPLKVEPQKVTLRDDGMTLINGKPFFPIGIYSVLKREFNNRDFDKAFAGLKDAGFNLAHTYGDAYNPEFTAAARKYGFKLWVEARMPDRKLLDEGRHNPSIIAWYLGDDTSGHQLPQEVNDNNAAVKAVDPYRLTCQADPIGSDRVVTRYAPYVRSTDVFMPEIYPVRSDMGDKTDATCVAETIRDMKRVASDVRLFGDGRPRGCWPIIQYFKGWGDWGHFPTRDQLFAMTWAAVIHGAHGMTWYTYGGFYDKKRKKHNEGVTSTPERWKAICDLATWLKELSPVLVTRTGKQPPMPEIVSGAKLDPLGQPSVTALLKRYGDDVFLFAVNAATEDVRARFRLEGVDGKAEAMKENRTVKCPDGVLEDNFKPFAVHVYRLKVKF